MDYNTPSLASFSLGRDQCKEKCDDNDDCNSFEYDKRGADHCNLYGAKNTTEINNDQFVQFCLKINQD